MTKNKKLRCLLLVCVGTIIIILLTIRKYMITKDLFLFFYIGVLGLVFIANILYYKYNI